MVVLLWFQPGCYRETTKQRWLDGWIQERHTFLITVKKMKKENTKLQEVYYILDVFHCYKTFVKLVFNMVLVKIYCHYKIDVKRDFCLKLPSILSNLHFLSAKKQSQPCQIINMQKCISFSFVSTISLTISNQNSTLQINLCK